MSIASPLIALAITVVIGTCLFVAARQGPAARPRGLLRRAGEERLRADRAGGQGDAAAADRARPGGLLSLQRLEHRRRRASSSSARSSPSGVAMQARQGHRRLDRRRRCCWRASLGGMCWAAIVALLRDRFNANEILVSLMLVYVAEQLLELPRLRARGRTRPATTSRRRSPSSKSTQMPAPVRRLARQHRRARRARRASPRSGSACSAPTPASSSRSAAWRRRRRATPASRRARRCGRRC